MRPISEQFSAAGKSQFDAQLKFMSSLTRQFFESTEALLALNIRTARASVDNSSAAIKKLVTVQQPRDLLALATQAPTGFDTVLAYSRELFDIAAAAAPLGLPKPILSPAASPAAALPAAVSVPVQAPAAAVQVQPAVQAPAAPAPQPKQPPQPEAPAAGFKASKKPHGTLAPEAAAPEVAAAKPIAKAASRVADQGPAADKPAAAPVASATQRHVAMPRIKPVDAAPPPAPVSGKPPLGPRQQEAAAGKGATRKK